MERKPGHQESKLKLKSALAKKTGLEKEVAAYEKEMFKYETMYLELTQGSPLTKTVEHYVNPRSDKKKHIVDDKMRMFCKNFPSAESRGPDGL
jgi:hypothetical protein